MPNTLMPQQINSIQDTEIRFLFVFYYKAELLTEDTQKVLMKNKKTLCLIFTTLMKLKLLSPGNLSFDYLRLLAVADYANDILKYVRILHETNLLTHSEGINNVNIIIYLYKHQKNVLSVFELLYLQQQLDQDTFDLSIGTLHYSLNRLFSTMGYTRRMGCCHGFSMTWMQACLIGSEQHFNERLHRIKQEGIQLPHRFHQLGIKLQNGITPEADDFALLDILAFLDAIEIFQSPTEHHRVFSAYRHPHNFLELAEVAMSDELRVNKGGLAQLSDHAMVATHDEIADYFYKVTQVLLNLYPTHSKQVIGLLLSSYTHSIGLTFNCHDQIWSLMDINYPVKQQFSLDKMHSMSQAIIRAFDRNKSSDFYGFTAHYMTTGDDDLKEEAAKLLNTLNLENQQQLVPLCEKRKAKKGITLAHLAAKQNNPYLLQEISQRAPLLLEGCPDENETTPLVIAIKFQAELAFQVLCEHGVTLNHRLAKGQNELFSAIFARNEPMVQQLIEAKANVNHIDDQGISPLIFAANYSEYPISILLCGQGVDLFDERQQGVVALSYATCSNNMDIAKLLIRLNVDPTRSVEGMCKSPLEIATVHSQHRAPFLNLYQSNKKLHSGNITASNQEISKPVNKRRKCSTTT